MRQIMRSLLVGLTILGCPLRCLAQPVPAGPEFTVHSSTTDSQRMPSVAMDSAGNFMTVWSALSDGDNEGVFGRMFDADGVPSGAQFQVNVAAAGVQFIPSVAASPSGDFFVVWTGSDGDDYGVRGRRFDSAGLPLGTEFQVNSFTTAEQFTAGGNQASRSVAVDGAGNALIAWTSNGQDGSFNGVYAQLYDSAGAAVGSEFQVNTYTTLSQGGATVAGSPGGGFLVTWGNSGDLDSIGIFAQRYDTNATPQGTEFQVNTHTLVDQIGPSAAYDGAGNFVVAWTHITVEGIIQHDHTYARRFLASGTPIGDDFKVSVHAGLETSANVASDADGNFVVTWSDMTPPGIFARRFASDGTPVGEDFRVNSTKAANPNGPYGGQIASEPGGRYVVVWNQVTPNKILAQRFAFDSPVAGKKLTFLDGPDPGDRKISVLLKDKNLSTAAGAGVTPDSEGAFLQVFNTAGSGESACIPLPAGALWQAKGAGEKLSYGYSDKSYSAGPCKAVKLKHRKLLKITCSAEVQPIAYSLDEPAQTSIGVNFVSGDATYCADFVGDVSEVQNSEFRAKNAPAPVSCPSAPAACP